MITTRQLLFVVLLLATGAVLALVLCPAAPAPMPVPEPEPFEASSIQGPEQPLPPLPRTEPTEAGSLPQGRKTPPLPLTGLEPPPSPPLSREEHLATLHQNDPPAPYARVGLLYRVDGETTTDAPAVLPLNGRATNRRAINFNYRSHSDTLNGLALNVLSRGTDCTNGDRGCRELFDDEVVEVPPYGQYRVDVDRD